LNLKNQGYGLLPMNLPSGYTLQREKYRLIKMVGQGGFGITYKGIWPTEVKGSLGTIKTDVPVCIKEYFFKDYCFRDSKTNAVKIHSETGLMIFNKFKEKLIKEAKILSDVSHPYIVNVLEVFEENETAYIVMEYIEGCTLKYMQEQQGLLLEERVLKYVSQIGEALQFVHDKNILHLDIKPSNILIDKNDNARLIDFGVSKRYDIKQKETSTTMLTLSKGFASIEQYDNEGTQSFSPCPDIYSLGATMYNLLTGKVPTESILRATRPLKKPSELNPEISKKTEAAIIKAMAVIPSDRFQSTQEMLSSLDCPKIDEITPQKNPLREQAPKHEEETILLPANNVEDNDSDHTVLNIPENKVEPQKPKKGKKKVLVGVLALFSISLAYAVIIFVQKDEHKIIEPTSTITDNLLTKDLTTNNMLDSLVTIPEQEVMTTITESPDSRPEPISNDRVAQQQIITDNPIEQQSSEKQPSQEEIDANYSMLIASGKNKMNIFDFSGARQDFSEAKDIKLTEEVVLLLIDCDTKETEKRIADRRLLYEEKMDFGKYRIVRKKSNGKYGAIDNNAEEIIPCIYLSVGRADNGRAFEREDNLFDIFDAEGNPVGIGLTFY